MDQEMMMAAGGDVSASISKHGGKSKRSTMGRYSSRANISVDFDAKIHSVMAEMGISSALNTVTELKEKSIEHAKDLIKVQEMCQKQEQGMI